MTKVSDPPQTAARADDCFAVLGLSPDASLADIRRAFRRRARQLHPDHGGDTQAFIALTRAYHILTDPERRPRRAARDQPGGVAWPPPPTPPPSPAPAGRSLAHLLWALPLLIVAAFGLDFAFRRSTPPHVLHAMRTATDSDRGPVADGIAADSSANEILPSAVTATDPPTASAPPPSRDHPVMPPAFPAAETTPPEGRYPPVGPQASAVTASVPPPDARHAAGPAATTAAAFQEPPSPPANQRPSKAEQPAPSRSDFHLVLFYAPDTGRQAAHDLAAFLQQQGYRLSAPTLKPLAGGSRVNFFHAADRPAADQLRRAVQTFLARRYRAAPFRLRLADHSQAHPNAPRGLIELWIGPPTAAAPQATKTAEGKAQPSLDERLRAFAASYAHAYASRDVVQVAALFHVDARENGRPIQTVLPIYRSNMAAIKAIDYRLELDGYRRDGHGGALHVNGRFFARLELPGSQVRHSRGTIAMQLLPYGQSFLIKQLDYRLAAR